jgi:putative transposase
MILKTFTYRLYPSKRQERVRMAPLEECPWLWNDFLGQRKTAWEAQQETITRFEQHAELPSLKEAVRPTRNGRHSQVFQQVAKRLDLAMEAFFRRRKAGEHPGYPRFRGTGRSDSLIFSPVPGGCSLDGERRRLTVSKVGEIKVISDRNLEGPPKTATIRRAATGQWGVTIIL